MAVSASVRIGGLADSTVWDCTDQLLAFDDSGPLIATGHMYNGDAGACQFELHVEDFVGEIPRSNWTKNLASHNVVTVVEDSPGFDCWIGRGRIAAANISRGAQPWGSHRSWVVTVDDGNIDFDGLALVEDWVRPAESGRTRLLAALAAFCNGDPRLTTVIGTHLVAAGGEVTMPAHTYTANTGLQDIFRDCAETEGKRWGAVIHHSGGSHLCMLYIDEDDHTTYASALSITDSDPDYVTSFPPSWEQGDAAIETGGDNPISHLVSRYGVEDDSVVIAENSDMLPRYDYWAVPYNDSVSEDATQAQARANAIAHSRRYTHVTHQVTIMIPEDMVDQIAAGMSIGIESAASMGGMFLNTVQTRRIAQCKFQKVTPTITGDIGYYKAHLQLDRPEKQIAAKVGLPVGPKPPTQPTAGSSVRLYFSSAEAGEPDQGYGAPDAPSSISAGDDPGWDFAPSTHIYMLADEVPPAGPTFNTPWSGGGTPPQDFRQNQYLYPLSGTLLAAIQAGGGTVRMQALTSSRYGTGISEANQDIISQLSIRVVSSDGSTIRGTAKAMHSLSSSAGSAKWPASATKVNRVFPPAAASNVLSAVASAQEGDYLLVEPGGRSFYGGATGGTIGHHAGNASDLPEDEVETSTNLNSWIEFSGTSSSGDAIEPIVNPGEESVGTDPNIYAPLGHKHAHGFLADDGTHMHDADQIDGLDELVSSPVSTVVDHGAMGTTEEFDATDGADHEGTLDDDLTITLTGATDGQAAWMTLRLEDDGSGPYTITWPDEVVWPGDTAPDAPAAGEVLVVSLFTYDGGSNWYGSYPGTGGGSSSASALPLTAVVDGEPVLLWDASNSLIASE